MDSNKVLRDWNHADSFLDNKYNETKEYVDKKRNPEFISIESNESTVLVPDNVDKYAVVEKIYGKTVKTKNLIAPPYDTNASYCGGYDISYDNTDGWITVSGTGTSTSTPFIMYVYRRDILDTLKQYTLYVEVDGDVSGVSAYIADIGTNVVYILNYSNLTSNTVNRFPFTTIENPEHTVYTVGIRLTIGATYNFKFRTMIYEGSKETSYEPYFDRLHSASVENVISTYTGNAIVTDNRTSDNTIYTSRTSTNRSLADPVDCVNHTFKYKAISKSGLAVDTVVVGYDSLGTKVLDSTWTGKSENTYTLTDDIKYVGLILRYTNNADIILGDISVEWNQNKTTISVPQSILDLPDYGVEGNYIDFENGKYYHNYSSVDLGTLQWAYNSTNLYFGTKSPYNDAEQLLNADVASIICGKYKTVSRNDIMSTDNSICVTSTKYIVIMDSTKGSDADAFRESLNGVVLVYKKDVPEIIDISDIISPIKVESGGCITFVNEHELDIQNSVLYKKKVI